MVSGDTLADGPATRATAAAREAHRGRPPGKAGSPLHDRFGGPWVYKDGRPHVKAVICKNPGAVFVEQLQISGVLVVYELRISDVLAAN